MQPFKGQLTPKYWDAIQKAADGPPKIIPSESKARAKTPLSPLDATDPRKKTDVASEGEKAPSVPQVNEKEIVVSEENASDVKANKAKSDRESSGTAVKVLASLRFNPS